MRRTGIATLCILMAATLAGVSPAPADPNGTLTPAQTLVTFAGQFPTGMPILPVPEVRCLDRCDQFQLNVALGVGYWTANGGGAVEIAVRWAYDGITDLDLYAYDQNGQEVGRSAAVDSNAESIFLPNAPDGEYTVRIVPNNTFNPDSTATSVPYDGLAQVEIIASDPPGQGVDLLPNLTALPPAEFHIASAANLIPFPENPLLSCYPEETIESPDHPTRCLRFNQVVANTGAGPLQLRFDVTGIPSPYEADHRMLQRVFRSDGTFYDRFAEAYEFHAVHGHIHYRGFGQSFLYSTVWGQGRQNGGVPVKIGHKVGFCVIDVMLLDQYWAATGNGPRNRTFPTCDIPGEVEGGGIWMVQGIDVGWADVYGWNLADQYIDITGVVDGLYELEQAANPSGSLLEQSALDNRASTVICLAGDTVTEVTTAEEAAACA